MQWLTKLKEGVDASGLMDRVAEAHAWLCRTYQVGDTLALFGFSRGAYEARVLVGLLRCCGVFAEGGGGTVKEALSVYSAVSHAAATASPGAPLSTVEGPAAQFRERARAIVPVVHFLGVFDTVPGPEPPSSELSATIARIPRNVAAAAQALALDETRCLFQPLAFTPDDDAEWDPPAAGIARSVRQLFFPGGHGDVVSGSDD